MTHLGHGTRDKERAHLTAPPLHPQAHYCHIVKSLAYLHFTLGNYFFLFSAKTPEQDHIKSKTIHQLWCYFKRGKQLGAMEICYKKLEVGEYLSTYYINNRLISEFSSYIIIFFSPILKQLVVLSTV